LEPKIWPNFGQFGSTPYERLQSWNKMGIDPADMSTKLAFGLGRPETESLSPVFDPFTLVTLTN